MSRFIYILYRYIVEVLYFTYKSNNDAIDERMYYYARIHFVQLIINLKTIKSIFIITSLISLI